MSIAERLETVRARITAACARAHRNPESVTLVAVCKTHPAEAMLEAIAAGQRHFGENRVEDAAPKIQAVAQALGVGGPLPTWHMIGHVQSRKAQDVVDHFPIVHSLDSVKLAERFARSVSERNARTAAPTRLKVLLEINISGEASKSGLAAYGWAENAAVRAALWADVRRMIDIPELEIIGLMTMAPIVENPELARPTFSGLRGLRDALAADFPGRWDALSMGMTDDYEIAIEEGASMVRIGRAIFGPRE